MLPDIKIVRLAIAGSNAAKIKTGHLSFLSLLFPSLSLLPWFPFLFLLFSSLPFSPLPRLPSPFFLFSSRPLASLAFPSFLFSSLIFCSLLSQHLLDLQLHKEVALFNNSRQTSQNSFECNMQHRK